MKKVEGFGETAGALQDELGEVGEDVGGVGGGGGREEGCAEVKDTEAYGQRGQFTEPNSARPAERTRCESRAPQVVRGVGMRHDVADAHLGDIW